MVLGNPLDPETGGPVTALATVPTIVTSEHGCGMRAPSGCCGGGVWPVVPISAGVPGLVRRRLPWAEQSPQGGRADPFEVNERTLPEAVFWRKLLKSK